jgi:hypothetical protein
MRVLIVEDGEEVVFAVAPLWRTVEEERCQPLVMGCLFAFCGSKAEGEGSKEMKVN